jgi:hypothetical protein
MCFFSEERWIFGALHMMGRLYIRLQRLWYFAESTMAVESVGGDVFVRHVKANLGSGTALFNGYHHYAFSVHSVLSLFSSEVDERSGVDTL